MEYGCKRIKKRKNWAYGTSMELSFKESDTLESEEAKNLINIKIKYAYESVLLINSI
jgi:hypothetical protein|tara:strand:- start:73 stop:243 length:171 start_codon:yes stop_codon:yes gene_type:complete